MNGICYIIGAGPVEPMALTPAARDFVIAADAGYLRLGDLSVVADLVVGDFDSMPVQPNHPNVVTHPREKDATDMMLAVDEGYNRGYRTFVLFGGLGGRLDHTLANLQTLGDIASRGARAFLLGDGMAATVIRNDSLRFDSGKSGIVSVFCAGEPAYGVTLRGLKYPLTNADLTARIPLGVSNEFTGAAAEVVVENGSLLVVWPDAPTDVIEAIKEAARSSI